MGETFVHRIQRISSKKPAGWIFAGMSGLSFTMSNFMVQVVVALSTHDKSRISVQQIVFTRCIVQLLFIIPLLVLIQAPVAKNFTDIIYVVPMGLAGYVNVVVTYLALEKIPLSDALLITFTSPFFCAIFSYCFLRERMHWIDIVSGLMSFIGVVLVARPSFIFGEEVNSSKQTLFQEKKLSPFEKETVYLTGTFFAFLGAIFLALYFVLARVCSNKVELNPTIAVFYPSLFGSLCSPLLMLCKGEQFIIPHNYDGAFMLISVGIYSTIALCFLTFALKQENATIVNLVRNLDVVYAFILQFLVFGIAPNVWNISGGIVIVLATASVVFRQWWNWRHLEEETEQTQSLNSDSDTDIQEKNSEVKILDTILNHD